MARTVSVHKIQLELARAHVAGHERDAQSHRALRMDGGELRRVNRVKGTKEVELAVVVRRGIAEHCHLNVHAKILTQRRDETKPQSAAGSSGFDLHLVAFDLRAVELGENGVGVFGGDVHKRMPFADVHLAHDIAGQARLASNGIHNINRRDTHGLANVDVQARLVVRGFALGFRPFLLGCGFRPRHLRVKWRHFRNAGSPARPAA